MEFSEKDFGENLKNVVNLNLGTLLSVSLYFDFSGIESLMEEGKFAAENSRCHAEACQSKGQIIQSKEQRT